MSYTSTHLNFKDEDKRLFIATEILSSLVVDRETTRNYSREQAVNIAVSYTDLLIKKLEEKDGEPNNV